MCNALGFFFFFYLQLVKGEILQHCKHLSASIKNNQVLVEQSFHSALLGDDDLKHYTWQPGYFIYWKKIPPEELSSTSLERPPNQILLINPCAAKLHGIDSWIHMTHLKNEQNPDWTFTSSDDLEVKISQN